MTFAKFFLNIVHIMVWGHKISLIIISCVAFACALFGGGINFMEEKNSFGKASLTSDAY